MAPKRKFPAIIRLRIQAGQANPAPPVGPALNAHGVNIMEFCKAYNAATENRRGNAVPTEISVYEDCSFTLVLKAPPATKLLLKTAGIERGFGVSHASKVGSVAWEQCKKIAELRKPDLDANDIEMGAHIITGTARSMGITAEGTK